MSNDEPNLRVLTRAQVNGPQAPPLFQSGLFYGRRILKELSSSAALTMEDSAPQVATPTCFCEPNRNA